MSANYHVDPELEEMQEPFMFVIPSIYKSKLLMDPLNPAYSIPMKSPKPNFIRRFLTKLLLGWSWENY